MWSPFAAVMVVLVSIFNRVHHVLDNAVAIVGRPTPAQWLYSQISWLALPPLSTPFHPAGSTKFVQRAKNLTTTFTVTSTATTTTSAG